MVNVDFNHLAVMHMAKMNCGKKRILRISIRLRFVKTTTKVGFVLMRIDVNIFTSLLKEFFRKSLTVRLIKLSLRFRKG